MSLEIATEAGTTSDNPNASVATDKTYFPPLSLEEIEAELQAFATQERQKLGLEEAPVEHWVDPNPQFFTRGQREHTTLLFGGLTEAQDLLIGGALRGLGYKVCVLETPDNESLRYGKEFGNRGQCNPTYFTVGNLVKFLLTQKEKHGLTKEEIVQNYAFLTAGACGPCRFGTYATEYRKALRDAGLDGFRVLLLDNNGGINQACGEERGLELNRDFFFGVIKALMIGDILNAIGYRIRPYERVRGTTDTAIAQCKEILHNCFAKRERILPALWRCRKVLKAVDVDRLQAKPKVSIIGEFWAMTTEGDGNYRLQRFLEAEGAEVDAQPIMAWLYYQIWQGQWDTKRRMMLREADHARMGLGNADARKKLVMLKVAEYAVTGMFQLYARTLGLTNFHLPDMDEIATISHKHYDNHLRGGEGHMEVGKVIQTAKKRKAHMVISIKPFGCMPSSGVSDGVQSLVAEKHPEAIFCAIETTGDAAVNMQSRVQMQLFKARQNAVKEFEQALERAKLTVQQAEKRLRLRRKSGSLYYPSITGIAGTAARLVSEIAPRPARDVVKKLSGKWNYARS